MRILSAGMDRSGSTWLYNAARLLLLNANDGKTITAYWADSKIEHRSDIELVKAHHLSQVGVVMGDDVVLTSYRDIRAVVGSLIRMRWLAPDVNIVTTYVSNYIERLTAWETYSVLSLRYEDMIQDGDEALSLVSSALGLQLSRGALQTVAGSLRALKVPKHKLDQVTQLHVAHIGDVSNTVATARVPKDVQTAINEQFGEWLAARHYH